MRRGHQGNCWAKQGRGPSARFTADEHSWDKRACLDRRPRPPSMDPPLRPQGRRQHPGGRERLGRRSDQREKLGSGDAAPSPSCACLCPRPATAPPAPHRWDYAATGPAGPAVPRARLTMAAALAGQAPPGQRPSDRNSSCAQTSRDRRPRRLSADRPGAGPTPPPGGARVRATQGRA